MPAKPPPPPSDTPEPGEPELTILAETVAELGPDGQLVVTAARDGACTHAENCAAATGRWLNHLDKAGQPTTRHEADGGFWNKKCGACSVRTYR